MLLCDDVPGAGDVLAPGAQNRVLPSDEKREKPESGMAEEKHQYSELTRSAIVSYGQAQPLSGLIDRSLDKDQSMLKIACIILGRLGHLKGDQS